LEEGGGGRRQGGRGSELAAPDEDPHQQSVDDIAAVPARGCLRRLRRGRAPPSCPTAVPTPHHARSGLAPDRGWEGGGGSGRIRQRRSR
jgi:hypothetical protein